jgi:hypothetical protein
LSFKPRNESLDTTAVEKDANERSVIRSFLEKNKIFFETVIPFFLSCVAVVISLIAYNLSKQQYSLAELSVKPDLYIKESFNFDSANVVDSSVLRIINSGNPITNVSKSIHSIAIIQFWSEVEEYQLHIPISGYYDGSINTGDLKGVLVQAFGHKNHYFLSQLHFGILSPDFRERFGTVFIEVKHAVRVSYKTKLGKDEEQFFIGTTPVLKDRFEAIDLHYNPTELVDISSLNADYIGKKIQEAKAMSKKIRTPKS